MKNETERTRTESPEELVEHISRLMSEAEALLVGPAASAVSGKVDQMRSRFHDLQSRMSDIYGDARRRVVDGAKVTDETIRSHPYESLAVTLGVGILIGALLRRGRD